MNVCTDHVDISDSMLIHAQPDLVSKHWDSLAPYIAQSVPDIANKEGGMARILQAILLERLQIWVYDKSDKMVFVGSTALFVDPVTFDKKLVLYTLSAIHDVSKDTLVDSYETIYKYAKQQGANAIWAFTKIPSIVKFAEAAGADVSTTLIEFPVNV